jgi:polyhydroxybutyrate depolymerase
VLKSRACETIQHLVDPGHNVRFSPRCRVSENIRNVPPRRNNVRLSSIIAAALAAVSLSSNAFAQTSPAAAATACDLSAAPGVADHELSSGGQPRTYRLFVPPSYDGRTRLPLVLDLHGSGGTSAGQANTSRFEMLAAREGVLVATLQAEGSRWNVPVSDGRPDDVAYAADVIDHVAARVCTDVTRVYATGFSGGGRMTSLLGCRLNERIAAIAPMAGLRWPGPCAGQGVPVLTVHGLADRQNTYDGRADGRGAEWLESVPEALAAWARHNGCAADVIEEDPAGPLSTMRYEGCGAGAEVRLIRVDGLGHTWAREEVDATAVMWEFFRRHTL